MTSPFLSQEEEQENLIIRQAATQHTLWEREQDYETSRAKFKSAYQRKVTQLQASRVVINSLQAILRRQSTTHTSRAPATTSTSAQAPAATKRCHRSPPPAPQPGDESREAAPPPAQDKTVQGACPQHGSHSSAVSEPRFQPENRPGLRSDTKSEGLPDEISPPHRVSGSELTQRGEQLPSEGQCVETEVEKSQVGGAGADPEEREDLECLEGARVRGWEHFQLEQINEQQEPEGGQQKHTFEQKRQQGKQQWHEQNLQQQHQEQQLLHQQRQQQKKQKKQEQLQDYQQLQRQKRQQQQQQQQQQQGILAEKSQHHTDVGSQEGSALVIAQPKPRQSIITGRTVAIATSLHPTTTATSLPPTTPSTAVVSESSPVDSTPPLQLTASTAQEPTLTSAPQSASFAAPQHPSRSASLRKPSVPHRPPPAAGSAAGEDPRPAANALNALAVVASPDLDLTQLGDSPKRTNLSLARCALKQNPAAWSDTVSTPLRSSLSAVGNLHLGGGSIPAAATDVTKGGAGFPAATHQNPVQQERLPPPRPTPQPPQEPQPRASKGWKRKGTAVPDFLPDRLPPNLRGAADQRSVSPHPPPDDAFDEFAFSQQQQPAKETSERSISASIPAVDPAPVAGAPHGAQGIAPGSNIVLEGGPVQPEVSVGGNRVWEAPKQGPRQVQGEGLSTRRW